MSTEIAKKYWLSQSKYPFLYTKRRRLHELNYLVPRLEQLGGTSVLDLGCGDGSLLECLLRLTEFTEFYGWDLTPALLKGIDPRIHTATYDIEHPSNLPVVDVTIVAGVIQYLFDDDLVIDLFERITSPVVWVRSTCSLKPNAEKVTSNGYASYYRTIAQTRELLSQHYEVSAVDRIYPDAIESAFGTKQYYFELHRRS